MIFLAISNDDPLLIELNIYKGDFNAYKDVVDSIDKLVSQK